MREGKERAGMGKAKAASESGFGMGREGGREDGADKSDVDLMNDDETALAHSLPRMVLALRTRTFMRLSGSHISSGRPENILARAAVPRPPTTRICALATPESVLARHSWVHY